MVQQSDGGARTEKARSVHSLVELVVSCVAMLGLFHRKKYGRIRSSTQVAGEISSSN
jgi:hypothetical protein